MAGEVDHRIRVRHLDLNVVFGGLQELFGAETRGEPDIGLQIWIGERVEGNVISACVGDDDFGTVGEGDSFEAGAWVSDI